MTRRISRLLLTAATLLLLQSVPARAYWDCYGTWEAWTTQRQMNGATNFECKGSYAPWPGKCGDWSHSWGYTWVDILGGISQSCQDHSHSFYGPYLGQWHGCHSGGPPPQGSYGQKQIDGVNQWWDRWPAGTYNGHYDPWTLNGLVGATLSMRDPYASIYDLDYCSIVQDIGTIFWGNFPVQSQLVAGLPLDTGAGYVAFEFSGSAGLSCSRVEDECQTEVCADLIVRKRLSCYWTDPNANPCGNGICDSGEDCFSCLEDCGMYCPP